MRARHERDTEASTPPPGSSSPSPGGSLHGDPLRDERPPRAAGHGALGSLSILALVVGLAKADRAEEQALVRFALAVVIANTILVGATGLALIALL
ncbi:hypothetical protein [Salinarimonas ramus]|uniref:hypothetical protein n=1 Tax=Salinarimonas ramus TaxID=690164 RepID=UPI001667EFBF|nr:hypothetical protein [Salinarimonas ramus]